MHDSIPPWVLITISLLACIAVVYGLFVIGETLVVVPLRKIYYRRLSNGVGPRKAVNVPLTEISIFSDLD